MPSTKEPDPGLPRPAPSASYWQCPPHSLASHQSPVLPSRASVVILGSGLTGASVAHHILKTSPSVDIVMLEARSITSGATGRNGGHCKSVPFKTYKKWKLQFGRTAAQRLVKFNGSHIAATRQLAHDLRDQGFTDAQFRDVESVTAVFDPVIFKELRDNMEDWLDDFPEERDGCSILDGEAAQQKYGILGAAGVLTLPAAALWPYRLVTSLIERLLCDYPNFAVEAFTPVTSISASEDPSRPYQVHTPRGTIRTQHVVHCTNGYASHLLPTLRGKIVPVRGQMTALESSDSFPRLGHSRSWSLYYPNGGFDYMTQGSDDQGHIFLGGGVEQAAAEGVVDLASTDDVALNRPAVGHLCSVLSKYFAGGHDTKLKQAWTGIMGFTPDGFPIVGKIPREISPTKISSDASGSEWIAAGFNGYGMVHCWHSGRAIADMICGVSQNKIEEYFPKEQFECSAARLDRMDYRSLHSTFYMNAPAQIRSRL